MAASSGCGTHLCARLIDCENFRPLYADHLPVVAKNRGIGTGMLEGSPYEYLHKPILEYLEAHGAKNPYSPRVFNFTEEGAETRVTGLVVAKVRHKKLSLLMHTSVLVIRNQRLLPRRGGVV